MADVNSLNSALACFNWHMQRCTLYCCHMKSLSKNRDSSFLYFMRALFPKATFLDCHQVVSVQYQTSGVSHLGTNSYSRSRDGVRWWECELTEMNFLCKSRMTDIIRQNDILKVNNLTSLLCGTK